MKFQEELEAFEATHPFKTMEISGKVFHYLCCGWEENPCTLVYFVGGTGNPLGWYRHVLSMEGKYRVLLLDYPMGEDRIEPMAELIGKLLDRLEIQKAVLIGASFGGYIAQLVAKYHPERTWALVLYATSSLTEAGIQELKQQYRSVGFLLWLIEHVPYGLLKSLFIKPSMQRLIPKGDSRESAYLRDLIRWICDGYTRESDLHMTRLMADIANLSPVTSEDYDYLEDRVLMVLPEKDQAFSQSMQQELIHMIPKAHVEKMEGGHLATLIRAEESAELTHDFLKAI